MNLSLNQTLLIFLPYVRQSWNTLLILAISMRGCLPLIQKYYVTRMHGVLVYVKEVLTFAQDLSIENSEDSDICFWLVLLHWCLTAFSLSITGLFFVHSFDNIIDYNFLVKTRIPVFHVHPQMFSVIFFCWLWAEKVEHIVKKIHIHSMNFNKHLVSHLTHLVSHLFLSFIIFTVSDTNYRHLLPS